MCENFRENSVAVPKRSKKMTSVKLFLLIAFLTIIKTSNGDNKEQLKKYHEECKEDTGVSQEKVDMVRNNDFSNDDEDLQKYVHCMLMKTELMTADGTFQKDVAMSKLPEDADRQRVSDSIDACIDEKGDTPHESAFMIVKCYKGLNPDDHYIF